jgi:ubiquinone/menaquinone biosynthesis C-methylase UbiE
MALCQKTGLVTYALDHSLAMLQLAKENITANSLTGQLIPILGDVHSLPFPKHSIDLIVSRGSIFFWDDLPKVFQDIARVLKPGGYAYIGGGFGSQELFESIRKQMEAYEDWETKVRQRMASDNIEDMKKSLQKAQIQDAEIKDDETGFWIIVKQSETSSA